jgi:hypothetical protein
VDEGYFYTSSGTDIATDTISKKQEAYSLKGDATNKITGVLESTGQLPQIGRESTRLYVIQNSTEEAACTSDVTYQPRLLIH